MWPAGTGREERAVSDADFEVHLTMVVVRAGKVDAVEHALLRHQAAARVLAGWATRPPGTRTAGRLIRAGVPRVAGGSVPGAGTCGEHQHRTALTIRAGIYFLLACLCFSLGFAFLAG